MTGLTPEQQAMRERVLKLEFQQANTDKEIAEVLAALHKLSNAIMTLQATLAAFENQGKGMKLLVRGFLAIGGAGWLAGLASFAQNFLSSK